jgi:hypothetical protein
MKLAERIGLEEHKGPGAIRIGIAAGLPLLAGGVFFLYRKLRHEVPPSPAWDAELKPPPIREEYRPEGDRPQESLPAEGPSQVESIDKPGPLGGVVSAEPLPPDRVEYTNEFGEKAVGLPGGGLDALPATPINETELVTRFGKLIGLPMSDLMDVSVGPVEAVYYRQLRGEAEWALTTIGMADKRRVVVPLDAAAIGEDSIRLSVPKSMIDEAPAAEVGPVMDEELEKGVYAHYMVRRMLPGLEGERDEGGVRLRQWAPAATEMGESADFGHSGKELS